MSIIGDLTSTTTYPVVGLTQRAISTILPDVVTEEQATDEIHVTDQPVETGTTITDHSFQLQAHLGMKVGFSDSTAGQVGYSIQCYNALLALQKTHQPFTVTTGKRTYKNMLMTKLTQSTDSHSEHALMAILEFREILIVQRQGGASSTGTGNTGGGAAGNDNSKPSVSTSDIDNGAGASGLAVSGSGTVFPDSVGGVGTPDPAPSFSSFGANGLISGGAGTLAPLDTASAAPAVTTAAPQVYSGSVSFQ